MAFPQTQVRMLGITVNDIDNRLVIQGHKSSVAQFQSRLAPRRGRESWSRLTQTLKEGVQVQLHRTDRLLEKKQNRGHEGEVAFPGESLLISPVLMAKGFLGDELTGVIKTLIKEE